MMIAQHLLQRLIKNSPNVFLIKAISLFVLVKYNFNNFSAKCNIISHIQE